jgi:transcription elongation factor Elf1
MKNALDSATVELPCPHCGKKSRETIGALKTKTNITCRHCGKKSRETIGALKTKTNITCRHCRGSFSLDASDLRREVAQAEKSLAQLRRTLGRFGK